MSFTISNSTVLKTTDEAFKWDRDHAVGKDEDREINVFPSKLSDAALADLEKAAKDDGDTRVARAAGAILRTRKGDVDIAVPNFKAFHSILTAFLRKSAANGWIFVEGKDGNSYPELVTDVRYERSRQPGGEDMVVIVTAYYGIGDNADKIARAKTSHSFSAASLRGRRVNDILLDKGIQVATEEMIAAHEASLARYHESVATKFSEQFRFTGRVLSRAGQDRYANKPAELRNRRVIHDLASTDHGPYARIEDSTILVDDESSAIANLRRQITDHAPELEIIATCTEPSEAADLIIKGLNGAIGSKRVTYDFARLMEGATQIKCSEFGDNLIAHM